MSGTANVSEWEGIEKYTEIETAFNLPSGSLSKKVLESASVLSVYYKSIGIVHYTRDQLYSYGDFAGKWILLHIECNCKQEIFVQVPSAASSASAWASAS